MKCNVTRQSATWLQQVDLIAALCKRMCDCRQNHHDCRQNIPWCIFEMLSWPHRTSANIINICFGLLETCTKCSYFIEENLRPGTQRLAFEVKYEYIIRRSTNMPACTWASFQTTGAWCVVPCSSAQQRLHRQVSGVRPYDPEPPFLKHCVASSKSRTYLHQWKQLQ